MTYNCVSPKRLGILGPARVVLPNELFRVVEACASSAATTWRIAKSSSDVTAEIQWPTGTTNIAPFLAFPPPLLTLVDDLKLPTPTWSISHAKDTLSCSLSWTVPDAAFRATAKSAVTSPAAAASSPAARERLAPSSPDSGYSSPPPALSPSPCRFSPQHLSFAEAVTSTPARCTPPSTSGSTAPPAPKLHKQHLLKTVACQTPRLLTACSATQFVTEPRESTASQTLAEPKPTHCEISTSTADFAQPPRASTACQTSTASAALANQSSQTPCPMITPTTTQTTMTEAVVTEKYKSTTKLQSSSCQSTPTPSSSSETQTVANTTSTTSTSTILPSCKLCDSPNLATDLTYHHLLTCTGHPTNAALLQDFVREWAPSQTNPDMFADILALLAAVGAEDPTQSHSDSFIDLYGTTTNILYANTNKSDQADDILDEVQSLMSTIASDTLHHLGLQPTASLSGIYEFNEELIKNQSEPEDDASDASEAGSIASDKYYMPVPDDVAYPDDEWTNFSDYECEDDGCYDDQAPFDEDF